MFTTVVFVRFCWCLGVCCLFAGQPSVLWGSCVVQVGVVGSIVGWGRLRRRRVADYKARGPLTRRRRECRSLPRASRRRTPPQARARAFPKILNAPKLWEYILQSHIIYTFLAIKAMQMYVNLI